MNDSVGTDPACGSAEKLPGLLAGGRGALLLDRFLACRRGVTEPLPPDAVTETTVVWAGGRLGERGLDLLLRFDRRRYVDRVILWQQLQDEPRPADGLPSPEPPSPRPIGQAVEAAERQLTLGIGQASVLVSTTAGDPPCLAATTAAPDGGILAERISLEVGAEALEVVLSLESFRRDVRLVAIEVWGGDANEPVIFPQPSERQFLPGAPVTLGPGTCVDQQPESDPDIAPAVSLIREALARVRPAPESASSTSMRVTIRKMTEERGDALAPESYRLDVTDNGIDLVGADRRGLVYGAAALSQLIAAGVCGAIAPCRVQDAPKMAMRGVHLYMPSRANVPFFRRLIRHLLAPLRYNTIILEVGAAMEYRRHPEINAAWVQDKERADRGEHPGSPHIEVGDGGYLTQAEVRELVEYAESYGIDVIPEVQSLSHVEFLTMAYPEIAEKPDDAHPDCYCPQNERSYEILFDVLDEVIAVFRPRHYIHMGHDEAYTMCVCDRCHDVPKAELFARDVNRIYEFLRSKNLGMMIWDDMIHTTRHFACPDAVDLLPKDIVLLNFVWYDRVDLDTEDRLLEHGFPVMIGNFYSSHFPRFASREGKPGLVGAEVSTWCRASEEDYGRVGKLYDFIYSANMMWSGHYRDELRRLYARRIATMLPPIRDALHGSDYPSRRPGAALQPLELGAPGAPRRDGCGAWGGYDLETLPLGAVELGAVTFALADRVLLLGGQQLRSPLPSDATLVVDRHCDSVVFLHACTRPGTPSTYNGRAQPVARYTYVYADGSRAATSIDYGWQLAEWNRPYGAPLRHGYWRHSGYTATYPALPFWQGKSSRGEDVTLYGYELINPHPDRKVAYVEITVPEGAGDAALLLAAATAVHGSE